MINEDNLKLDCGHIETGEVWELKEALCMWNVHSKCPYHCINYIKEETSSILEKKEETN